MRSIRILTAIIVFTVLTRDAWSQVPQLINYQGRVTVGGTNFNGTGQFKFRLLDPAGPDSYWSNDGSGTEGEEPDTAVSVTVTKGLYSVLLGDTTLPNMTAIPAAVFNNSDVWLRVWFDDGVNGFQLLSPDQRIAAVGYAMMAANVSDGAITTAKIAAGAVGSAQIASGAVLSNAVSTTNGITLGVTVPGASSPSAPLTMIASGTGSTRTTNSIRLFGSKFNIGSTGNSNNIWHSGTLSGGGGALSNVSQLGGGSGLITNGTTAMFTLTNGTTLPAGLVLTNLTMQGKQTGGDGGTNLIFENRSYGTFGIGAIYASQSSQWDPGDLVFLNMDTNPIARLSTGASLAKTNTVDQNEYVFFLSMPHTSGSRNIFNVTGYDGASGVSTNSYDAEVFNFIFCDSCGNANVGAKVAIEPDYLHPAASNQVSLILGYKDFGAYQTDDILMWDFTNGPQTNRNNGRFLVADYFHEWRFGMLPGASNFIFETGMTYDSATRQYHGQTNLLFNIRNGTIRASTIDAMNTSVSLTNVASIGFKDGTVQTTAATGGLGITGAVTNGQQILYYSSGSVTNISGSTDIITGQVVTANGTITSLSGGFKFPDGTVQTTASSGGGGITDVLSIGNYSPDFDIIMGSDTVDPNPSKAIGFESSTGSGNSTTNLLYADSSGSLKYNQGGADRQVFYGEIELLTGTTDNAGRITNYFSPGLILVDASFNPTNVVGRWASLVSIRTNRAIYHVFGVNANDCNNCTVVGPARAYAQ